ncbi:MAG: two-component system regulatory protein YycI [Bacillaceae bacterium]|nr:two-component system regulatory protein YycI [Bacillaceae bacterium]
MDWSRAKTLLILSFLFLDFFLGWQLWVNRGDLQVMEQNLGGDARFEDFLQKHDIILKTDIPTDTPDMYYLHVRYGAHQLTQQMNRQGQSIELKEGVVESEFNEPIAVEKPASPDDWPVDLKNRIYDFDQYRYDPYQRDRFTFIQVYDGLPMFNAVLQLDWVNGTVRGYEQTYFQVVNRGSGRKVISASIALRGLVENGLIRRGENIESIQLGYYSPTYNAEIQVLSPVWRIVHNKTIHYVNGITGVVEKLPSLEKLNPVSDNN